MKQYRPLFAFFAVIAVVAFAADVRIKNITSTTTTPASDDYVALDGTTNGTRKMLMSTATINTTGNITGNVATFTSGNFTSGNVTTLSATNITGATAVGQLFIGNNTSGNFTKAQLTQGAGITITNADASITVTANVTPTNSIALSNKTYEGLTVTTTNGTLTIANSKTLTVSSNATINGSSSTGLPDVWVIPIGDETTAITTGTAKVTFRAPYAATVTSVRASLNTVSSSGTPTFDINEGGTSILSTKLTIDANELTSTTAATAAVISDTALADDAEITIDIDTAGTGAKGAKIAIYVTR